MPTGSKVVNIDSAYESEPGYYSYIQKRIESAGGELVLVKAYTEDDIIAACGSASVVLADQVKSLDWRVRRATRKGAVSAEELSEVRAKILTLIG